MVHRSAHAIVVAALILIGCPVGLVAQERRTALVIGNSAYSSMPLVNPRNDAEDMAQALRDLGFGVTVRLDAGAQEMFGAIRELGNELIRGGMGLFYYSGHGLQGEDGRNYLIPVDADIKAPDEVRFLAIDAGLVLSKMESAGNSVNLVILDACRDSPFRASFRSASRGLAVVEAPRGSLVVYATAPGSVAAEGTGRNGIFTAALLRRIKTPGLEVESMLKSVRQEVMAATGNAQVPWSSSSLSGGFYFAGGPGGTTQPSSVELPAVAGSSMAQTAELYVVTQPTGAEVMLDGERRGISPILLKNVPVGREVRVQARSGNRSGSTIVALDKVGLHDLRLALEIEKGNLIVMSADRALTVTIDGRQLGELGTGLFRDIETGSHALELRGAGLYWSGEVTVSVDKTTEVRAEPYAVAEILFDIPSGAEAALNGMDVSQSLHGTGKQANLRVGRYEIAVSGIDYESVRFSVDLSRGQVYELRPYRTGTLVVESRPPGATVRIAGTSRGATPVTMGDTPAGNVTVELALDGYRNERQEVPVAGGKTNLVSITLERLPLLETVLVQGGTFEMGDTIGNGASDEQPVHTVAVSSFHMAKTEVTFDQFDRFSDETGRSKPSDRGWGRGSRPAMNVSWFDAAEFCNWLSRKEGLTPFYIVSGTDVSMNWAANGYRLPTEAEWEYAARGGNRTRGTPYAGAASPEGVAWYRDNSGERTQTVGTKAPNELGLHDMSGNVWEWCNDRYGRYTGVAQTDPRGPENGTTRVMRSGSWNHYAPYVRAADRANEAPTYRDIDGGFRPVRRATRDS